MIEYLVIMSVITFLIYGLDKFLARKRLYRFPESALLSLAFVGGVFGALLAMLILRHKTKKRKFQVYIPLILLLWINILLGVYSK